MEKISDLKNDIADKGEKIESCLYEIEEMKKLIERNTLDIDSGSLKLNQKINELKKIDLTREKTINDLILKQKQENKSLKDLKASIENELKNIRESIKESIKDSIKETITESNQETIYIQKSETVNDIKSNPIKQNNEEITKLNDSFLELKEDLKKIETDLAKKFKKAFSSIEFSMKSLKSTTSEDIVEIREKLSWLPINLRDIKGMNPTEARMFILEARLRSEENIRNASWYNESGYEKQLWKLSFLTYFT